MKKERLLLIIILLFFIILNYFVFYITKSGINSKLDSILTSHMEKLETNYKITTKYQKDITDIAYRLTINNEKIIKIFKEYKKSDLNTQKNLRETLKKELDSIYKGLKEKGVLQYHFICNDNTTLFRMHKPSKYNDDLTLSRKDIAFVNKTKKELHGFAESKTSHGFKHIYPVFDKEGNHLGAVDIAFSSDILQEEINKISSIETHFLVKKDVFNAKIWERDDMELKYIDSLEHKDFKITITKSMTHKNDHNSLEEYLELISKNIDKGKKFNLYTQENDRVEVISFLPIKHNMKDTIDAWLVSYEKNNIIMFSLNNMHLIRFVLFLSLAMIFYILFKTVTQKEKLSKLVDKRTKQLKDQNLKLEKSESKLKTLNESLEEKIKKEVDKNRQKDIMLTQQSKMAQMGEMIESIAHQWKQPLAIITVTASGVQIKKELGGIDDKHLNEDLEQIINSAEYLTQTINDFRSFYKKDKEVKLFDIGSSIEKAITLLAPKIQNKEIIINKKIADHSIEGFENELIQVFMNILNNAIDALEKVKDPKIIDISTVSKDKNIQITFHDNAGGINENILSNIFDNYFTTKEHMEGTGIGLYMSKRFISKADGKIKVSNKEFEYEKQKYLGAEFIIELPLKKEIKDV